MTNGPEPKPRAVSCLTQAVRRCRSRHTQLAAQIDLLMVSSVVRSVCLAGTVCQPILCRYTARVKGAHHFSLTAP